MSYDLEKEQEMNTFLELAETRYSVRKRENNGIRAGDLNLAGFVQQRIS